MRAGSRGRKRCGDGYLFAAHDPQYGDEPWFTDGTVVGTRVLDLTPGMGSTTFGILGAVGERALMWRTTAALGSEPWTTDGTVAGTSLLGDLEPGPASSSPDWQYVFASAAAPIGQRRILIPIDTSATGRELWITDGTSSGTALLPEIRPGPASSLAPAWWFPAFAGNTAVFFADAGTTGFEPWAVDLDGVALGLGGYGSRGFAVEDPVLGAPWSMRSENLQPQDAGVAILGLPSPRALPFGAGAFAHFDLGSAAVVATIAPDPTGTWSGSIPLPGSPVLAGLDLVTQSLFASPAGVEIGPAYWLTLGL